MLFVIHFNSNIFMTAKLSAMASEVKTELFGLHLFSDHNQRWYGEENVSIQKWGIKASFYCNGGRIGQLLPNTSRFNAVCIW